MKFSSFAAAALATVPAVLAAPVAVPDNFFTEIAKRQSTPLDVVVLQFALTLEHLENVFYKQALKNFTQQDFQDAGYGADYYNNLQYIAHDEETHVTFLTSAITTAGYTPVAACTYNFPYTDVLSFITLSSVLEGVGTSAYLAGAPLITSKAYLTAAGSILTVEALHTSMQRAAINEVPMANPFGTPLDPTSTFTLASAFIVSCPASNYQLPFTPFPALAVNGTTCTCEEPNCNPGEFLKRDGMSEWQPTGQPCKPGQGTSSKNCPAPAIGSTVTLTAASKIPKGSYVTFVSGLSVVSVQGTIDGADISVVIPSIAMGQTYVFITSSSETTFVDTNVLFGPAVLEVAPPPPTIDYTILKV